ncbi:hypothetical protein J1N35_037543, partial [Gossypium stocksii]
EAKCEASVAQEKDLEEKVHHLEALERYHLADKVKIQKESNAAVEKFITDTNNGIKA